MITKNLKLLEKVFKNFFIKFMEFKIECYTIIKNKNRHFGFEIK